MNARDETVAVWYDLYTATDSGYHVDSVLMRDMESLMYHPIFNLIQPKCNDLFIDLEDEVKIK